MSRLINLKGQTFGKLNVVMFAGKRGKNLLWLCTCECGGQSIVLGGNLRRGLSKSCGCQRKIITSERKTTHGHANKGKESSTYNVWLSMKGRTGNPANRAYKHYGGRGITMCDDWFNSFESFLRDMGERPADRSIDRIDNNQGYYKDNCRWATLKEQANNKRSNVLYEYDGKKLNLTQWANLLNISRESLSSRFKYGWSIEKILGTPIGPIGTNQFSKKVNHETNLS